MRNAPSLRRFFISLAFLLLAFAPLQVASAADNILFMRHTLAPGYGDPEHFDIDDCSTQRNLSDAGRLQAENIGKTLLARGWRPTRILTSPWCRCKETAQYLGLGDWSIQYGLGSFFRGHVDRDETLTALDNILAGITNTDYVLLITHQVVIQAVTGLSVPSGGLVAYNPETNTSRILKLED